MHYARLFNVATIWFALLSRIGRGAVADTIHMDPKIINGDAVNIRDALQAHVSLEYGGEIYCGGTVIGPETILTAAHCIDSMLPLVAVFTDGTEYSLSPSKYHIHPSYSNERMVYDAAVIETSRPIPSSIRPVPVSTSSLKSGEALYIHGRGDTIEDESPGAKSVRHKKKKKQQQKKPRLKYPKRRGLSSDVDAPAPAPGPQPAPDPKFLGDVIDGIGGFIDDAVDWVGDTFFGDEDGYYYYYYDDEFEDITYYPEEPLRATMYYESDTTCTIQDRSNEPSSFCAVSDYQNICGGDSGGGVIRKDGSVVGMVSTSTLGCDPINGRYESTFTDLTNNKIASFVKPYARPADDEGSYAFLPDYDDEDGDYDGIITYGEYEAPERSPERSPPPEVYEVAPPSASNVSTPIFTLSGVVAMYIFFMM
jgi:hypothetical protein